MNVVVAEFCALRLDILCNGTLGILDRSLALAQIDIGVEYSCTISAPWKDFLDAMVDVYGAE